MNTAARFAAALAFAVALPAVAGAQTWRTLDVSRQLRDTTELHVHVQYAAGRLTLRAAAQPVLYAMNLRYDEDRTSPLHAFDAAAGTLDIGIKDVSTTWTDRRSDRDSKGQMNLTLAPTVPLDLTMTMGATAADIDLGGLTLRGLHVESGATDETLDFSVPNRARMGAVSMDVGAASLTARNLANANASSLHVKGGVGALDLGFGGTWTGDLDATVQVTLGKITLRIPRDVGVQLDLQRFLTSFDDDGLIKRDGSYFSDNWDTAKYHLRLHVQTTLGGVVIDRFGSSAAP
ncbi:MAG TPA: hypothetical protein VMV51_08705 [Gemmatimonadaceae bacterium]|nr:hypothetical protein [Gemmatimonadaceae bacterium]